MTYVVRKIRFRCPIKEILDTFEADNLEDVIEYGKSFMSKEEKTYVNFFEKFHIEGAEIFNEIFPPLPMEYYSVN